MEDLPLSRIAALVPEFAVKDLPLGRTLMINMPKVDYLKTKYKCKDIANYDLIVHSRGAISKFSGDSCFLDM